MRFSGAWVMHPLLIIIGKMVIDALPGMTNEASWTIVNLAYTSVCDSMFERGAELIGCL